MNITRPSLPPFQRDAKLLIAASGLSALSFYGINGLLKVLYVLRLGYGPEYVGVFGAAGALAYTGMGLPAGALGNRFGTRKTMLVGSLIAVVAMAIFPLAEFVPSWARGFWPIASQVVLVSSWATFNVNLVPALMAATSAQERSSAFALNSALRGLGTFLGTVLGGLLPGLFASILGQSVDLPGPYRVGLWVGAGLSLIGLVPLGFIRHGGRATPGEQARARGPFPLTMIALMVVHVYLSHAGWAACQAFCSAYMDTDLHLSALSIGLVTGVGQFVAVLAPLFAPRLARRLGNSRTLLVTALGMAISVAPLALIPHWAAAGVGRMGVLTLSAVWLTVLQVYQMELVESGWRSLAYGALSMGMGFSFGSVSLAGGYIVAAGGYRSLFLLGIGLTAAGAVVMLLVARRREAAVVKAPVPFTGD